MTDIYEYLAGNRYPGRGVLAGCSEDGCAVLAYFIMGRSANSRNRIFVREGDDITILPFDPSKVEDPSLIIYHPVRTLGDAVIFTNGDQTDTVREAILSGGSFDSALMTRTFEPDSPNYTPRVSGIIEFAGEGFTYELSILKAGYAGDCKRQFFRYEPVPGRAHIIHTYQGDGAPLPSFRGEPAEVKLPHGIDGFTQKLWDALDANNRVSLYVRCTSPGGKYTDRLVNRFGSDENKG